MTTREYLTATLSKFNVSEKDIDLLYVNQGIETEDLDVNAVKLAIYNEFSSLLPLANISEGGLSITWNMDALKIWYSLLAKQLGKEDVLKSISGKDVEVNDVSYLM